MASHFKSEPEDMASDQAPVSMRDLASIGQDLEEETPATADVPSEGVFGVYHKHQSRKSRNESKRRARGTRRKSSHRHHHHHRHHHRRTWPKVVAVLVLLLLALVGVEGFLLYRSSQSAMAHAKEVKTQAALLKDAIMEGDSATAQTIYDDVSDMLYDLRDEVNTPVWRIASFAPVVGRDVTNGQVLADCACDLMDDAVGPLVQNAAGLRLADLVKDRRVDTQMLASLRGAVESASPALIEASRTLSSLEHGSIDKVNDLIDSLAAPLSSAATSLEDVDSLFTVLLAMLGDSGQTRTYVILAQTNSEIRANGGFLGSVGTATVTDGKLELGEFKSVYEVKDLVLQKGGAAQISSDELEAFGDVLSNDAAGPTLTPNFVRSGEIAHQQWQVAYDMTVDGVVAMDPVFLQRVLAITGGVTAEDGTVVDGSNAAEEILKNVYWRYGFESNGNDLMDAFFADVADRAFNQLLDSLGGFEPEQFAQLWDVIGQSGEDNRFMVWMADETQQSYMHKWGLTGELQSDVTRPVLGLYANDNTWAKLTWYLDISADLGEPIPNADGTTSYHVTAHYRNTATEDEISRAPGYVTGGNPLKRSKSDMVETTYVLAPLGATITDYEVHQDAPLSADKRIEDLHLTLYDRDCWRSRINILAGGDTTITFTLTLPTEATEPLQVRTDPLCHE